MAKAKLTKTERERLEVAKIARENFDNGQSVRFHIIHQRNGMGCKARLWHWDGHVIASAGGCGYDREGTVLGQVLESVWPERLAGLPLPERSGSGGFNRGQLYGLFERSDGTRYLDGGCGWESMVKIAKAMRLDVERYETGKLSTLVTIRPLE